MKIIKIFLVASLLMMPLVGCQTERAGGSVNEPTPRSIALNYLFVHGMCQGYLQNSSVTEEQFQALVQLDQQAKLSIMKTLSNPSTVNLEKSQYLMRQIIMFITHDNK